MRKFSALFPVLLLVSSAAVAALDPKNASADYAKLQGWKYSAPVQIPAGGVTITRDGATWKLESGSVRLMEPASDGTVTGLVFEGQGRFTMAVPDKYELAQLRRFAVKPDLEQLEQPITQLVLRTSDPAIIKLFPASDSGHSPHPLAEKRHTWLMTQNFTDVDAQVVAALLNPGALRITADMKTADYDWLTWDYDSQADEEITVLHYDRDNVESWVSIDRAEDRRPDGRTGARAAAPVQLTHIDVVADLTKRGSMGEVGRNNQRTINGQYVVTGTFTGLAESVSALRLELWPMAKDVKAFSESGEPLTVFREHIGKRSALIDNKLWDDDFVVVLPTPIKRGEARKIRFEYEVETANYAPGGIWYPTVPGSFDQRHTARLEMTVQKKNELRAMGRMESKKENGNSETSIWLVEKPAKMITFSTATRFEEVKLEVDGIPPVISFGPDFQFGNKAKVRNVGADVANSLQFFQILLQDRIDASNMYVTSIAAGHGQAFDGFLHMTEYTYESEHPGASELFRAHEVAHEWFGHKIGWKSYRDQWLSEAFAEYAAMMFVEGFVKGGDKYMEEILKSYDSIVKGNFGGGFSKFNRPWLAGMMMDLSAVEKQRVGPIGHGWRANTAAMPAAYQVQAYHKGPLVLHMLRMLLRYKTNNDDLFVKVLRDYVKEYGGKSASTEDFRRVLERAAPGDWGWFFDSWVYGNDLPSYTWKYDVKQEGDGFLLTVDAERRNAAESFMTIIPVRVEFDGNRHGYVWVYSRGSKSTVTQKLPAKPKKVTFGPDWSLLASIRRD